MTTNNTLKNLVFKMKEHMTWKEVSEALGYSGGWTTAWYLVHDRKERETFDPRLPEHYRV